MGYRFEIEGHVSNPADEEAFLEKARALVKDAPGALGAAVFQGQFAGLHDLMTEREAEQQ